VEFLVTFIANYELKMKFKELKAIGLSAVSGQIDVTLAADATECHELRAALAVVDKYKKAALKAIREEKNQNPMNADWHMISYCVKGDKVIVSVKDGMAG
jgi:hypothetical protein